MPAAAALGFGLGMMILLLGLGIALVKKLDLEARLKAWVAALRRHPNAALPGIRVLTPVISDAQDPMPTAVG